MSAPSAAVQAQAASIRALIASNLYDTKIVGQLEDNVKFQMKNACYDAEANRELMQLYALAPDMLKSDILSRLLLKSLMQLPAPDFVTSLYLLPEKLHSLEPVRVLSKLHTQLDTCNFKKFWQDLEAFRAVQANAAVVNFAEAADFDQTIRKFIVSTISATYSSISTSTLKDMLNLSDKKSFEEVVAAQQGWTLAEEGKTVVLRQDQAQAQGKEEAATATRTDCPSIEQLARLITAA